MEKYNSSEIPKSSRITRLVDHLYAKMPEIESYRAKLITESYKETEDQPIITRRAKAFSHILHNIPIIIRDEELIVGSNSIAPRGCQTFPEFSYQWLEDELDTVAPELPIHSIFQSRLRQIFARYTNTGKARLPVSSPQHIWHRKQSVPSITIFLHQEIISTMV